jgi:dipeptidyl aminopeptidase/acylaminoacyl peptidase
LTIDDGVFTFSPDSQHLLCLSGDAGVSIHPLNRREPPEEINVPIPPTNEAFKSPRLWDICCTPDNNSIVCAGGEGTVFIIDRATQQVRLKLPGHTHQARCVAVSADGKFAASCGSWGIKLWDASSGKKRGSFEKGAKNIELVAFSPDSQRLAWAAEYGRLTVLEIDSRRVIYSVKPQKADLYDIAFSPCGRFLATTTTGGDVKLLDAADGREIVKFVTGGCSNAVAFSPDGKMLAATNEDLLLLWDLQTRACVQAIPDTRWLTRLRFSPDGKYLAAFAFPKGIRIWRVDRLMSLERDVSALRGNAGTVSVPVNPKPAVMLAQAVTTPVPAKMPAPAHLQKCTAPVASQCRRNRSVAHLQCPYGGKKFSLLHAGATREQNGVKFPKDTKVGDAYFMMIKAVCAQCHAEHLIFDKDFHGWNGFVVNTGERAQRPELVAWICTACGKTDHSATVAFLQRGPPGCH